MSLVDGAACAAVAVVPAIATATAATTRARSLVRACDNAMGPFFRWPPTGLADGFGREEGPTAGADSPQVLLGGSPARCAGHGHRPGEDAGRTAAMIRRRWAGATGGSGCGPDQPHQFIDALNERKPQES